MRARPSNNVQWKGTDLCLDLYCDCGMSSHADGYSFSYVQCPGCDVIYKLQHNVPMTKVQRHDDYVPDHPLRASEH